MIEGYTIIGTATSGGAGTSTSTTVYPSMISGRIIAVGVVFRDSPPGATTDVTVRTAGVNSGLPKVTLYSKTDSATNVWVQPHALIDDINGADIAANYTPVVIHDQVEVVVTGANDGDSVDVVLMVER